MFRILVTFTRFVVGLRAWKLCITIKTCYFLLSHRCYNRFEALRGFASPRIVLHGLSAPLSASQRLSIPLNSSQRFSAPLNASQRLSAPLSTSHNKKQCVLLLAAHLRTLDPNAKSVNVTVILNIAYQKCCTVSVCGSDLMTGTALAEGPCRNPRDIHTFKKLKNN